MYQETLNPFTKVAITTKQKSKVSKGEQLEHRYNQMFSVLPPSQHPDTDGYTWINPIENTPIAECPTWVIEQILGDNQSSSNPDQLPLNFDNNINNLIIPLYNFLSKNDRQLIDSGAGSGSRNDSGAKLARNLIGTAQRLNYLGYQTNDNPEDLFNDFCERCNPALPQKERKTIWKSALKDNPTSTLTDDYLENIYKSFQQQNKRQQQSTTPNKSNYQSSGNTALKPDVQPETQSNIVNFPRQQHQLNIDDLEQELQDLAEQTLSKSKQQLKINELGKKYNLNPKEIAEIYKNKLSEIENDNSLDDIKSELDDFLDNKKQSLDTLKYLPGSLNKITEMATRLCLRPELGLTIFYTTISSLFKVGSEIQLSDYTSYPQPMGIYSAIVAEPSQRKSPLINAIATKPLRELLKKHKEGFLEEMKQYAYDLKDFESDKSGNTPEPEKPTMRQHYINSATAAGLRDLLNGQAKNGWGLTLLADEISGWFKSQGQSYNVGLKEDCLSFYDGFGKRDALKGGMASDFEECLLSILGGIQPNVFREFNDGSDDNGSHSRFNFINQPTQPFLIPDNPPGSLDLTPMLSGFYEKISELPQLNLRLSPEAIRHFEGLNNKCEMYRVNAKSQALAALWGKMPGKIGRFTALIHVVEQLAKGNSVIDPIVGMGALNKAAKLCKFYYKEAENLYAVCSTENQLAPQLAKILELAEKRQAAIGARDIKAFDRSFNKSTPDDVRAMFTQLVELGYGELEGSGTRLKFKITPTVDNCRQTVDKTVDGETTTTQGLQPIVDTVDKKNKKFQNENHPTYMDEITHIDDVGENPKEPEILSTVSTIPPNIDTEASTASTVLSTERLQLSTVPSEHPEPGKLDEMVKAEPLPSLINRATRINFDSLQQGDVIYSHLDDKPYYVKQKEQFYALTSIGLKIDNDNIGNFYRK
jgi:hypothetical protein